MLSSTLFSTITTFASAESVISVTAKKGPGFVTIFADGSLQTGPGYASKQALMAAWPSHSNLVKDLLKDQSSQSRFQLLLTHRKELSGLPGVLPNFKLSIVPPVAVSKETFKRRTKAATTIQAAWRGHHVRETGGKVDLVGDYTDDPEIQELAREVGDLRVHVMEKIKNDSRRQDLVKHQRKSATKIQAAWRGHHVRTTGGKVDLVGDYADDPEIQELARKVGKQRARVMKEIRSGNSRRQDLVKLQRESATKIQAAWRGHRVRETGEKVDTLGDYDGDPEIQKLARQAGEERARVMKEIRLKHRELPLAKAQDERPTLTDSDAAQGERKLAELDALESQLKKMQRGLKGEKYKELDL